MANFSFNTQGATPVKSGLPFSNIPSAGSNSPYDRALGSAPFTQKLPTNQALGSIAGSVGHAIGNIQTPSMPTNIQRPSYLPKPAPLNLPGLLNPPATPALGSLNSSPVTSHTVTTKPDGTTTQKVTHDTVTPVPPQSTANAGQTSGVFQPGSPQNSGSLMSSGVADSSDPAASASSDTPQSQGGTTPNGTQIGANGTPLTSSANPSPSSYQGIIGGLVGAAKGNEAIGNSAADIAARYGQEYADVGRKGANAESGYLTTGTTPVAEGNAAIQVQNTAAQQAAIAKGEEAALQGTDKQLTAQNQEASALNNAGGLAAPGTAFAQLPYNAQLIDSDGKPVNGGATGGNLNDAVANVTKQLQAGTIGYDDAKAQLSGYGQGGLDALSRWATDNKFNVAQSNTLAAQQGAVTPNLNYAQAALTNLQSAMSNLQVWGQNSNIPILGGLANWFSSQTGVGKQQTSNKAGAVGEAQQAISAVLASVRGGTPTDYSAQSKAILPDNPTPADVAAAQALLSALGSQKQAIYGNPGQQSATSQNGSASTGKEGETTSAGGYNFVFKNGQWVAQ